MKIEWENKSCNYAKAEKAILEAKNNNAEVLFFPEMSFTGFSMNIKETAEFNQESLNIISQLCIKYKVAVGFGWVRGVGEKAENCYSVVDRYGVEISRYVKVHPFSYSGEDKYFVKGKNVEYFRLSGKAFSTAICYDLRFPELFQGICKNNNISAIVVPANWPQKRELHWQVLSRARAIENQVYIIAVNCVGEIGNLYYSGGSCVIHPNGNIISCVDDNREMLFYANIDEDVEKLRCQFPVRNDRQVDFYKNII